MTDLKIKVKYFSSATYYLENYVYLVTEFIKKETEKAIMLLIGACVYFSLFMKNMKGSGRLI